MLNMVHSQTLVIFSTNNRLTKQPKFGTTSKANSTKAQTVCPLNKVVALRFWVEPNNPKTIAYIWPPQQIQLVQMKIATRNVCVANSPNKPTDQAMMYCDCQIRFLYELYGIESLAYLYHQQTSSVDNPHYNLVTYGNFMTQRNKEKCLERYKTIDNKKQ